MSASIEQAAISLGMATLMGACIGFERQWGMAGLRTNTLVAIGAASFVVFSGLFPGEDSRTRMAAQAVSGIGFFGAGIIFRERLHITGLNTAATLWCSAAVGLLAGSGHPLHAALATSFMVLANLTLRSLVRIINRQPLAQAETDFHYRVRVVCRNPEEALRAAAAEHRNRPVSLRRLDSTDLEESGRVDVTAQLTAQPKSDAILEQVVDRLSLEPTVPPRAGVLRQCGNGNPLQGVQSIGAVMKRIQVVWKCIAFATQVLFSFNCVARASLCDGIQ